MRTIREYIGNNQRVFADHPFFQRLARSPSLEELAPFALDLSFWVMSFQDVLRLNERNVVDQQLSKIARHHRAEDSGHDRWFIADLGLLDLPEPDLREIFGKNHETTRHASYQLVSEVFRARNDLERVALLLTLESSGHVLFEATASYFERTKSSLGLKYFSRFHLDVETQHALFEQKMDAYLDAIQVSNEDCDECLHLVDRCYAAFVSIFDNIEVRADTRAGLKVASSPILRQRTPDVV